MLRPRTLPLASFRPAPHLQVAVIAQVCCRAHRFWRVDQDAVRRAETAAAEGKKPWITSEWSDLGHILHRPAAVPAGHPWRSHISCPEAVRLDTSLAAEVAKLS